MLLFKNEKMKLHWGHFLMFFILFFTNQMDFRDSEMIVGAKLDLQVIVRLAVLGLFSLMALPFLARFFVLCKQMPIAFHLVYLVYLCLVSINPETVNFYSFYALATHIAMFMIIVTMVDRFGMNNVIYYYFLGVAIFCVFCLYYYYAVPGIGRYIYWQDGEIYVSTRLKGISGHPNTLGFMTAAALISFFHLCLIRYPLQKILSFFAFFIILACLILTNSRSSILGTIVACGLYAVIYYRAITFTAPILSALIILFIFVFEYFKEHIFSLLGMFSRSGNIEEITSMTGRSAIWDQMFQLIEMRPFFGWGHATLEEVLVANADKIGFAVGQAHNLYLQVLFVGGFVGLLIFLISIGSLIFLGVVKGIYSRAPFELCIVVYTLLGGVTESIILTTVSTNNYLVFVMAIAGLSLYSEASQKRIPSS